MKKLIITVMVLLMALGLLQMGTYSVFATPEITDPGRLSLNVFGKNTFNEAYYFSNIKPGDSVGWGGSSNENGMFWNVKNTGTIDGSIVVSVEDIKDNGSNLSTQIMTQLWINGLLISESSDIESLPVYQKKLASGEEIKVDIAWKFKETAENEYQGASTRLNVKFNLTGSPPDILTASPTDINTESSEGIEGISVLSLTGPNNIIPIIGVITLLIGLIIIIFYFKRKIWNRLKSWFPKIYKHNL
jgi:hypothetical protein